MSGWNAVIKKFRYTARKKRDTYNQRNFIKALTDSNSNYEKNARGPTLSMYAARNERDSASSCYFLKRALCFILIERYIYRTQCIYPNMIEVRRKSGLSNDKIAEDSGDSERKRGDTWEHSVWRKSTSKTYDVYMRDIYSHALEHYRHHYPCDFLRYGLVDAWWSGVKPAETCRKWWSSVAATRTESDRCGRNLSAEVTGYYCFISKWMEL